MAKTAYYRAPHHADCPVTLSLSGQNIHLHTLFTNPLNMYSSINVTAEVLESRREEKDSEQHGGKHYPNLV
jgi:hypothetical protein